MLDGKVALVTGASRGIGAATARQLAADGAAVVVAARNAKACSAVVAEITAAGGRAEWAGCDVSDFGQMAEAVGVAVSSFGGLDILVNNAAIIEPIASVGMADPDAWADSIAINLVGAFNATRAALPHLRDRGVIVNVSSGAARRPMEGWSAYCAAKAGLAMFTKSLALELPREKVRVYGYAPGTVDTDMQVVIRASGVNPVSRMKRSDHAHPDEPAKVIAWLCGPEAVDLSGRELTNHDADLRRRVGLPE